MFVSGCAMSPCSDILYTYILIFYTLIYSYIHILYTINYTHTHSYSIPPPLNFSGAVAFKPLPRQADRLYKPLPEHGEALRTVP
jgi:hypothetical protein